MVSKNLIIILLFLGTCSKLYPQKTLFDSNYLKLADLFAKEGNTEKLDMLDFLKTNINIHYSDNYFWQDSIGNKIEFDELKFENFNIAVKEFELVKKIAGQLTPVPTRSMDKDIISFNILLKNIEATYNSNYFNKYPKNVIHDYLLPYRNLTEPVHDWRNEYHERFKYFEDKDDVKSTIKKIIENVNLWYLCTYGIEKRTDPLPFLGASQLLHRKKGSCEDVANLMVFALRSLGVPCAIDIIPYWGTTAGGHSLNTAFCPNGENIHFDALINSDSLYELVREPAKVFRKTYSINSEAVASYKNIDEIPNYGMLREKNYIDVTKEYCNVSNLVFNVPDSLSDDIIYASVFNKNKWRPVWYGYKKGTEVTFTDMVEGVLYTPYVFNGKKLKSIGYPKAFSNGNIIELNPNDEVHSIEVDELPRYLKYKNGVVYTLYYYDKRWIKIGSKVPNENTKALKFNNVPKNALLILKPQDSKGKERPFTIDDNGLRSWW